MARILVLDDDKLFGALMRRGLGQRAHEVWSMKPRPRRKGPLQAPSTRWSATSSCPAKRPAFAARNLRGLSGDGDGAISGGRGAVDAASGANIGVMRS
jgi:hypothetical protein